MLQVLSTVWPFILDVFGNKKMVTIPLTTSLIKVIIIGSIIIMLLLYLYQGIGKIFFQTHDRYLEISNKFLSLEKEYQTLTVERDVLYRKCESTESQLASIKLEQIHLIDINQKCKQSLEEGDKTPITIEKKPERQPIDVNTLLKKID